MNDSRSSFQLVLQLLRTLSLLTGKQPTRSSTPQPRTEYAKDLEGDLGKDWQYSCQMTTLYCRICWTSLRVTWKSLCLRSWVSSQARHGGVNQQVLTRVFLLATWELETHQARSLIAVVHLDTHYIGLYTSLKAVAPCILSNNPAVQLAIFSVPSPLIALTGIAATFNFQAFICPEG